MSSSNEQRDQVDIADEHLEGLDMSEWTPPADQPGWLDRRHLLKLADQCERGATDMEQVAGNAAEELAERGYPNADAAEWAARKLGAATAARAYAQELRAEAEQLGETGRVSEERIAQAEHVATAATVDGILIDGRRVADDNAEHFRGSALDGESSRLQAEYAHRKAAEIEGTGVFTLVADSGQVPFWQLGDPATSQSEQQAVTPGPARPQAQTDEREQAVTEPAQTEQAADTTEADRAIQQHQIDTLEYAIGDDLLVGGVAYDRNEWQADGEGGVERRSQVYDDANADPFGYDADARADADRLAERMRTDHQYRQQVLDALGVSDTDPSRMTDEQFAAWSAEHDDRAADDYGDRQVEQYVDRMTELDMAGALDPPDSGCGDQVDEDLRPHPQRDDAEAAVDYSGPGGDHDLASDERFESQWPETKNFEDLTPSDLTYLAEKYPAEYGPEIEEERTGRQHVPQQATERQVAERAAASSSDTTAEWVSADDDGDADGL